MNFAWILKSRQSFSKRKEEGERAAAIKSIWRAGKSLYFQQLHCIKANHKIVLQQLPSTRRDKSQTRLFQRVLVF